jgi:hypothetical protein
MTEPSPSEIERAPSGDNPLRNLPPSETRHWLPRHKAAIVAAVRSAAISSEEACERYRLTIEEFLSWKETIAQYGVDGLKATARDRRKAPRQSVAEPGTVSLSAHTQLDCVITNISDAGARLRLKSSASLPAMFELQCHRSKRSWPMELVWQNSRSAGVRFNNPLPQPWTIKSGLGAWLIGKRRTVCIDKADSF